MPKISDFKNPAAEFRAKPFWAWNAKLEETELRKQINMFKEMGFGGAFMHSRTGLATAYLSDEWFDAVKISIEESKKAGLEAWLYDEDRWPSGSAGGIVTKNPEYRSTYMGLCILDDKDKMPEGDCYAIFDVDFRDEKIYSYKRVIYSPELKPENGHKLFFFQIRKQDQSSWFNGYTYVDPLSEAAIGEFIKVTHEAYAKHFKNDFGKTVPGIFTDEPSCDTTRKMMAGGWYRSPWTVKFPDVFRKEHSYDISDFLPEIYFKKADEDFSKVKYDYRYIMTELFSKNFGRQIGKWCKKNGLAFTGHLLSEEPLIKSAGNLGSAMQLYQYFQAPGVDILTSQGIQSRGNGSGAMKSFAQAQGPIKGETGSTGLKAEYLAVKQCASVKDQFARKWMISETYGCTGWHSVFAEYKAISDWQAALGVNLRCPHLSWYSMKGEAKRDFPATFSYQSPWWKDYKIVEDYFGRVNMLLSEGRAVKDIAVINPNETIWGTSGVPEFRENMAKPWDEYLDKIQNVLLKGHFDFDYIDEGILAEYGDVNARSLKVAKSLYHTVIVPPMATIRKSTLDFLMKFKKRGGHLLFIEPLPAYVGAIAAGDFRAIIKEESIPAMPFDEEAIAAFIKKSPARCISLKTEDGTEYPDALYQMRYDADSKRAIVFIAHLLNDKSSGILTLTVPFSGNVYKYDCLNGEIYKHEYQKTTHFSVSFDIELDPYGSAMFVIDPNILDSALPMSIKNQQKTGRINFASKEWLISRDEPNAFPLDYPEYSIDSGKYEEAEEVLLVDQALRKYIGVPVRGGDMCQPWAAEPPKNAKAKASLKLKYKFFVDCLPASHSYLVMETPEAFRITLNGETIKADTDEGWWIDKSFRKLKIEASCLKCGVNELLLETEYNFTSGLESLYFIGEFGVKWVDDTAHITELPKTLKAGNWMDQGFPAYSGAITYSNTFKAESGLDKAYVLTFPDWQGCLLKVRVNASDAGVLPWPPYELDISRFLRRGENNDIEITVVSTRKNILGPLHYEELFPRWTGPGEYLKSTVRSYQALPYGLIEAPYITVTMR